MNRDEIRKKAIECGKAFETMCNSKESETDEEFNKTCHCGYNEFAGFTDCAAVYGYEHGFEEGMREAFRMVLNEIPCKTNCQCCLRDGDSVCFIPNDRMWFVPVIVDMIRQWEKKERGENC